MNNTNTAQIFIPISLPGTGKTTYFKKVKYQNYISKDEIRQSIINPYDLTQDVDQMFRDQFMAFIANNTIGDIVIDKNHSPFGLAETLQIIPIDKHSQVNLIVFWHMDQTNSQYYFPFEYLIGCIKNLLNRSNHVMNQLNPIEQLRTIVRFYKLQLKQSIQAYTNNLRTTELILWQVTIRKENNLNELVKQVLAFDWQDLQAPQECILQELIDCVIRDVDVVFNDIF